MIDTLKSDHDKKFRDEDTIKKIDAAVEEVKKSAGRAADRENNTAAVKKVEDAADKVEKEGDAAKADAANADAAPCIVLSPSNTVHNTPYNVVAAHNSVADSSLPAISVGEPAVENEEGVWTVVEKKNKKLRRPRART